MKNNNAVNEILHNATGKRMSGRDLLIASKRSILDPEAAKVLKTQWQGSGRDNALVVMKLSEQDGSNAHYVTGWNGKDTFVCMTATGLTYVDQRKLEKLIQDDKWNPETRLLEVRNPLLRENMERSDVDMLLDRIKKTLTKSGKARRKGRLRNMGKFFAAAIVDESSTITKKSSDSKSSGGTEFIRVSEKDDRIPEAPKAASTSKLPKGRATESFNWNLVNKKGRPLRRSIAHPWMESNKTEPQVDKRSLVNMGSENGGSCGSSTSRGNKTDPQFDKREFADVRGEDSEIDDRELVDVNGEVGSSCRSATSNTNKANSEFRNREQVNIRSEDASTDSSDISDDPDYTTYAGNKVKDASKEFSSRPKIAVRHEAVGSKKAKKLFGPNSPKKSPEGAKKPLLMLVLMGKKHNMSEGTTFCPTCGKSHGDAHGPMTGLFGKRPGATPGSTGHDICPNCRAKRKETGGSLNMSGHMGVWEKLKKEREAAERKRKGNKNNFESSNNQRGFNLLEGKRKLHPTFLANIEKMKEKARIRKAELASN
jgi:hypothetical protein